MSFELTAPKTDLPLEPWPKCQDIKTQHPSTVGALLLGAKTAIKEWLKASPDYAKRVQAVAQTPGAFEPGGLLYPDIGNEDYVRPALAATGHTKKQQTPGVGPEDYVVYKFMQSAACDNPEQIQSIQ